MTLGGSNLGVTTLRVGRLDPRTTLVAGRVEGREGHPRVTARSSYIAGVVGLAHLDELISSLPSFLDAVYKNILSKIPEGYPNYTGRRILKILCLSNRPLTMDELVHTLTVDLSQKKCLNIKRLFHINELRIILNCLIKYT